MNRYLLIALHVFFWIGGFWYFNKDIIQVMPLPSGATYGYDFDVPKPYIQPHLFAGLLFNALLFYVIALVIIPTYLVKNNYKKLLLASLLAIIIIRVLESSADMLTCFLFFDGCTFTWQNWWVLVQNNLGSLPFFAIIGFTYGLTTNLVKLEKQRSQLIEEKLKTELDFLKNQLNPHFLFNTLNNFFSMALSSGNKELADGISGLSAMMRYMLYESEGNSVPLAKELSYIKHFIEIYEIRFNKEGKLHIKYCVEADEALEIAPMILIPLIENTFKHGIDPDQPATIEISIKSEGNHLTLKTKNKVVAQNKTEGGIGLENLKRRLQLLYANRHQLNMYEGDNYYVAQLDLNTKA